MDNNWFRKGLVVGIIVLFISIGVQPVFAEESITTSGSVENCIECQESEGYSHLRVNLLLVRLKVIVNFISSRFGDIPEIVALCNTILEIITNGNIHDLICDALLTPIWLLMVKLLVLAFSAPNDIMFLIYYMLAAFLEPIFIGIAHAFNCEDWEPREYSLVINLGTTLNQIKSNFI